MVTGDGLVIFIVVAGVSLGPPPLARNGKRWWITVRGFELTMSRQVLGRPSLQLQDALELLLGGEGRDYYGFGSNIRLNSFQD